MSKYPRLLLKLAHEFGAQVEKLPSGHYEIFTEAWRVTASGTPRCPDHALCNVRRDLQKKNPRALGQGG